MRVRFTPHGQNARKQDGINYHFIEKADFSACWRPDFLESAEVYGHHYGTSKMGGSAARGPERYSGDRPGGGSGQGAVSKAATFSSYRHTEATDRLRKRAQDDDAIIARRMEEARDVMQHVTDADFLVVNEDFATALGEMRAIIQAQGLKVEAQARLRPLLQV